MLWPSDSTSGNILEGTQPTSLKEDNHPSVHGDMIYTSQDMDGAQVSISRWVYKTTMQQLHNEILSSHNKEENFTLSDSVDGPGEH